jgi:hypothetical protein
MSSQSISCAGNVAVQLPPLFQGTACLQGSMFQIEYLSHLQYITEACCVQLSFYGTGMTTSHNHNIGGIWKATEKRHLGLRQHGTWQHLSAPKQ